MLVASKLVRRGGCLAPALIRRAATIELDWDTRQKSRFDANDSLGRSIGVFLPRGTLARGGDVLIAEDGSLVAVRAKPQSVLRVTLGPSGAPADLHRAAYHLGNRHVPLEVTTTHLQLEPDHVLAAMLRRMGLAVEEAEAPFEPEAGAYDSAQPKRHGHGSPSSVHHGHDHDHGHTHNHSDNHHDAGETAASANPVGPAHR